MLLAEWKFKFFCDKELSEEQVEKLMQSIELIEERVTQYIKDNKPELVTLDTDYLS